MELSVDRLTKHYGKKIAVDCVSMVLRPGVYGLLGKTERERPHLCGCCALFWKLHQERCF